MAVTAAPRPWSADRAAAVLLCLLAFTFRVYRLDYQSFHYDEYFSVTLAGQSLGTLIARLTINEPHPPLYYSLLHIWLAFAGDGAFVAKFLSLLFGVLVVPVGYLCGRALGGPGVGLAAALLLAVNPFQLYHSQETRMYSAFEFFALLSSYFVLRLLREPRRRLWLGYAAATALAAAAHYEMLLLLAAQVVFMAGRSLFAGTGRFWISLRPWVAAWGAIALLYLPWLVAARHIAVDYKASAALPFAWPDSALRALQQARETFVAFNFHLVDVPYREQQVAVLALMALAALAGALFRSPRPERTGTLYLLLSALLPLTLALAFELRRPVFAVRYMIFISPVLALLLALGAARLARLSRGVATLAVIALALSYTQASYALYVDPDYARADYRGLFRHLQLVAREGDALLLNCPYQDWASAYYFKNRLPAFGFPLPDSERPAQEGQLAGLSSSYRRLWLVLGGDADCDPAGSVERALAKVAFRGEERRFSTLRLVGYAGARAVPAGESSSTIDFGGRLDLASWHLPAVPLEPGEVVPVQLAWRAAAPLDVDYAMSLRLLNGASQLVEQRDGLPQGGFRPTRDWRPGEVVLDNRGLPLPAGLPPGDYQLELHVYDAASSAELPAARRAAGVTTGGVTLGTLHVAPATAPPPEETIPSLVRLDRQTGPLRALGYRRAGPAQLQPGQKLRFVLFFRRDEAPLAAEPSFEFALERPGGQLLQRQGFRAVEQLHPAARWQPGELVRRDYDFVLAPTVGSGQYRLSGLLAIAGRRHDLFSESLSVRNDRPLAPAQPSDITSPRETALQHGVKFLGHDSRAERGGAADRLLLTLYWSTDRDLARDYTVFVHALDDAGQIVAQDDTPPARGAYPTSLWPAGEIIRDEHIFQLPIERVTSLAFGLYLPSTGERLCIVDPAGHCAEDSISVPLK